MLRFFKFNEIAYDLACHILPRCQGNAHMRIDVFFPTLGERVAFVVFRPMNYTQVWCNLPERLQRDLSYWKTDQLDRIRGGWVKIANHDSEWREWLWAFDHQNVNCRTDVIMERIRIWWASEDPKDCYHSDWQKTEKTEPFYDWQGSVSTPPAWTAVFLETISRYWAKRGFSLGEMEYEVRNYRSGNRFLRWTVETDGGLALNGVKTGFRKPWKAVASKGSVLDDIIKHVVKPWKTDDFSDGLFTPAVKNRPFDTWGF